MSSGASRICKLSPEETVECSAKVKLSVEAHGTECLMHNLCGMDGHERVASLTMPKSARYLWSICRIVRGSQDKHGPSLSGAIRRLAVILRRQELSTVTALVSKNAQPIRCNFLQFHACGRLSKMWASSNRCTRPEKRFAKMRSAPWDLMTNLLSPLRKQQS